MTVLIPTLICWWFRDKNVDLESGGPVFKSQLSLLQLWFSQSYKPSSGFLDHMVVLFLVFKVISILFSIVAASIYIPTNSVRGFPFLHTLFSMYCL